MVSKTYFGKC